VVPFDIVVQVTERKPRAISVKVISGNLKQLEGAYRRCRPP
jgi:hypothetical protein